MNSFFKLWKQQEYQQSQSTNSDNQSNSSQQANTNNNDDKENEKNMDKNFRRDREDERNIARITNSGNSHVNLTVGAELSSEQLQRQAQAALNPTTISNNSRNTDLSNALIPLLAQLLTNTLGEND